jgi:hypothetical protein
MISGLHAERLNTLSVDENGVTGSGQPADASLPVTANQFDMLTGNLIVPGY